MMSRTLLVSGRISPTASASRQRVRASGELLLSSGEPRVYGLRTKISIVQSVGTKRPSHFTKKMFVLGKYAHVDDFFCKVTPFWCH